MLPLSSLLDLNLFRGLDRMKLQYFAKQFNWNFYWSELRRKEILIWSNLGFGFKHVKKILFSHILHVAWDTMWTTLWLNMITLVMKLKRVEYPLWKRVTAYYSTPRFGPSRDMFFSIKPRRRGGNSSINHSHLAAKILNCRFRIENYNLRFLIYEFKLEFRIVNLKS